MVAVAREAPAYNLGDDVGTALDCVFVALEDNRCAAAAGHQTVAACIEGTAGFLGSILADGEGLNAVEGSDAVHVVLLCAAAYHAVLQALCDEQSAQADALRAGGTGSRRCEVDATQLEEACQVHGDVGVHALEDGAAAAGHGAACLTELVEAVHRCLCHGVVAVDDAHFVRGEEVFVDAGILECLLGGNIAVLCLFGHEVAEAARNVCLDVHCGHVANKCRAETSVLALLTKDDATLALIECVAHFVEACSDAGPDAHACYNYSSCHYVSLF